MLFCCHSFYAELDFKKLFGITLIKLCLSCGVLVVLVALVVVVVVVLVVVSGTYISALLGPRATVRPKDYDLRQLLAGGLGL